MQFQIPNPGDNLTIGDLVKQYIKTHLKERNQGWTGIPFLLEEVPYSQVMNNIVDSLYQRLLSYAKIKSLNLITRSSKNVPLFAAAINPKGKPNNIPIPTATIATAIEVWVPTIIIESISRPK